MSLTVVVDVAIGLVVVYLGASLFVTIINEHLAQAFKLRARTLRDSLRKLIQDPVRSVRAMRGTRSATTAVVTRE